MVCVHPDKPSLTNARCAKMDDAFYRTSLDHETWRETAVTDLEPPQNVHDDQLYNSYSA